MEETEADTYNLSSKERKQTLKISLINNQQISMIIVNLDTEQRYSAMVTLPKLKELCKIFQSIESPKEALSILKTSIESGGIVLIEDLQENIIELKYTISTDEGDYPPFDINLYLEKGKENENKDDEEDVQVLQPIFDYKGNQEAETKYGNTTKDTTEFVKPIVQSNVKPADLVIEIIEPIVQTHYPDGTTKSTALPPRIQGPGGEDITEEQLKSIQEQINNNSTIKNFSPLKEFLNNRYKSNSVAKRNTSIYSTQSTPYPTTNNIARVNPFNNNVVRPANQATQTQIYQNNVGAQMIDPRAGINQMNMNNINRTTSGYSTMTMQARPLVYGNNQYITQGPNPTIYNNNLSYTNAFQGNDPNKNNKIIERRPRMINQKSNNPKDSVRSFSTPHENFGKFSGNQNQNIYQPNPTQNPFQTNRHKQNQEKYLYDRNTQKPTLRNNNIKNNENLTREKSPQNHIRKSNNDSSQKRSNQPRNNLAQIQLQQQRLKEVQEKLAYIQQQQLQLQAKQKELALKQQQKQKMIKRKQLNQDIANSRINNPPQLRKEEKNIQKEELIRKTQSQTINTNQRLAFQSKINQQQQEQQEIRQDPSPPSKTPIKKTNSLTNNPKFQNQSSQEIKQSNTQGFGFKTKTSTPIPSQTPTLGNINQQLLNLAQMASMQNEANPEFQNMKAFTLEEQEQNIHNTEEQDEIQEYHPQEEVQEKQYAEEPVQNEEEVAQPDEQSDINIEALFFTEEGRVIFRNGLLRGIIHKYAEIDDVVGKIQDILLKGVKFTLVYKAFDVGDRAKTFHEKCDKLKMSLVLIETDKDVRFRGFTTKSWEGNCLKKIDNNTFVFSLDNNTIFDIIKNEPTIGCYPKYGPVFF